MPDETQIDTTASAAASTQTVDSPAATTTTPATTGFMVTVEDDISEVGKDVLGGLKKAINYVKGVAVNDVWKPAIAEVTKLGPDEWNALYPLMKQTVTEVIDDVPLLLAGGWEGFAAVVTPLLIAFGVKAANTGIEVAKTDALVLAQTAIADVAGQVSGSATQVSGTISSNTTASAAASTQTVDSAAGTSASE